MKSCSCSPPCAARYIGPSSLQNDSPPSQTCRQGSLLCSLALLRWALDLGFEGKMLYKMSIASQGSEALTALHPSASDLACSHAHNAARGERLDHILQAPGADDRLHVAGKHAFGSVLPNQQRSVHQIPAGAQPPALKAATFLYLRAEPGSGGSEGLIAQSALRARQVMFLRSNRMLVVPQRGRSHM